MIETVGGVPLASGYERIEHGGRGDYVEFTDDQIYRDRLHMPEGTMWRVGSRYAYYVEWRTSDGVMVYRQKRPVSYAKYIPGRWYVSVDDCVGWVDDVQLPLC